ncbi:MAG: hypothetical protein AAGG56_18810, partial [Pseudomonadota bacterium]
MIFEATVAAFAVHALGKLNDIVRVLSTSSTLRRENAEVFGAPKDNQAVGKLHLDSVVVVDLNNF